MQYGTAGVASISPDPAFIPAGQLAANINLNALAAGTTTITPTAPGVSGTASNVNVGAPTIAISSGSPFVMGAGQFDNRYYVYVPRTLFHSLTIGLVSTDSTVSTPPPTAVIPANSNYMYFTETAPRVGRVTETASAPGWTSAVRTVIVSTPRLFACCANTINTTSANQTASVTIGDSVGGGHYRINPLFVSVTSSDTTILRIIDTLPVIGAGATNTTAKYKPGGFGGVAYVRFNAGGHTGDSIKVTVIAPSLAIQFYQGRVIGADQQTVNFGYVQIPNAVGSAVSVNIASADTSIAFVTPLITIPAGQTYSYFDVRGHTLGHVQFLTSAAGYAPDSDSIVVSSPRLTYCCGFNLPNFAADAGFTQYTTDSLGTAHNVISPVKVSYSSTAPLVAAADSASTTVPSGQYYTNTAKLHILGVGTGSIIATAPGYRPDTMPFTIYTPTLGMYLYTGTVGLHQRLGLSAYGYTPNARPDSVIVHIANTNPSALGVVDSIKILKLSNLAYFDYSGLALGKATLTLSATGYNPVSGNVIVTSPILRQGGIGTSYNTTSPPVTTYVYPEDTIGYSHYTLDTVAVKVTSSDTTVLKVDSAKIHIFKGTAQSTYNTVRFVGPGTAYVVYKDSAGLYHADSTAPITVIGPSLRISAGTTLGNPVTLGMRQHVGTNGMYVYVDNAVTGSPLTVNLLSTDVTVATVPATVTIPVGSTVGYFDLTALDTTGTIQIKLSATGYAPVVSYVQVGQPQFAISSPTSGVYTTSPPTNITVYAEDQAGNLRYTTENVVVTLTSSNTTVAAPDSATITIVKDNYYHNSSKMIYKSAGTTVLTASDARVKYYKYQPASTGTITVATPTVTTGLSATNNLGLDQTIDTYVQIPNPPLSPPLTVTLSNSTGAATTPGSVSIPAGNTTANYRMTGASPGTDVFSTSATGYNGASATIVVDSGTIQISGWPGSVKAGDSVGVQLLSLDPAGTARNLGIAVTFTLAPNGNIVFDVGGATTTTITIPVNVYYSGTFYVKGVASGTGQVTVKGGRFKTYVNTLTVNP